MKKTVLILLSLCLVVFFVGCGGDSAASRGDNSTSPTVSDIMDEAENGGGDENGGGNAASSGDAGTDSGSYDIDLTELNATMVYSQVFDMVNDPDSYLGKSVKMAGTFQVYEGESQNYFACLIADATACCAQGIEFVWEGDHSYPDDYPAIDSEITVTGVFDTYMEDDQLYCRLIDAELTF